MKTFIMAALAVAFTTSTAFAGEIVWRPPTSGVLKTVVSTPIPDPADNSDDEPSAGFGISYPVTNTALAKMLTITPSGPTFGVSFDPVDDLPTGLIINNRTGQIVGIVVQSGTHTIKVRLIKGDVYQVVPVVIVAG